jgi:hypothetical protein
MIGEIPSLNSINRLGFVAETHCASCEMNIEDKAIRGTGRGCPQGSETSRLLNFLANQLTDGCGLMHWPDVYYPEEDSWYSFLLEAESTPGP